MCVGVYETAIGVLSVCVCESEIVLSVGVCEC